MPSKVTGSNVAVRSGWEQQFDPASGWKTVETWNGSKSQIAAIIQGFRNNGAATSVKNSGALWTLTVTWSLDYNQDTDKQPGAPPATEVPLDTWDVDVEWAEVDVRASPKVIAYLGGEYEVAVAFKQVDAAIKAGLSIGKYLESISISSIIPTIKLEVIYRLRARGVTTLGERRPVLTRKRTYTSQYTTPLQINAVETVYTTSALITNFSVPNIIQQKLPVTPVVTQAEAAWGWRIRKQSGTFTVARNKIEETMDFVFAQWSTLLYDFIP
jgi:hypothetical protein